MRGECREPIEYSNTVAIAKESKKMATSTHSHDDILAHLE